MGSVPHEHVRPGIDHRVRELLQVRALVVRVDGHDHVFGQPRGVVHDRRDLRHVLGIGVAVDAGLVARMEHRAEQVERLARSPELVPLPECLEVHALDRLAQFFELAPLHVARRDHVQRVEAGTPAHSALGRTGDGVGREGRRHRDQRDAAVVRLEEAGLARLGQVLAGPRGEQAGRFRVPAGDPVPVRGVVAGVVVRHRHHVEPGPDQLVGQVRVRAHPGAAAGGGRIRLVVVEEHLEVDERGVRAPHELDHVEVHGLLVGREPPGDDGVSRERHREHAVGGQASGRILGGGLGGAREGHGGERDADDREAEEHGTFEHATPPEKMPAAREPVGPAASDRHSKGVVGLLAS